MARRDDRSRPPPTAERPAVPLALAALAGVALAQAWPSRSAGVMSVALALAAAVVFAIAGLVARARRSGPEARARVRPRAAGGRAPASAAALALVLAAFALLGAARALDARAEITARALTPLALPARGVTVMLKGCVCGRAARLPGGRAEVPLEVESFVRDNRSFERGGFRILARIPPSERRRAGDLLPGRRLELEGRLAIPAPSPLAASGGASALLEREGLAALLEATSVWRLESGSTSGPSGAAARLARRVGQALAAAELDSESDAILRAILLGDRSRITPEVRRAFVATGTIHLLVVAGLHVALLAGLLGRSVRALPIPDLARRALVVGFVIAYVAVVGPRPGALRAGLGAILVALAGTSGRAGDAWNRLALAALVLLAWDPAEVGEAGFQLSFGTVAGILALTGLLADRRAGVWVVERAARPSTRGSHRRGLLARVGRWLAHQLAMGGAVFVAHAPLAVAWFGQLAPIGILANVIALPLAVLTLAPAAVGAGLGAVAPALGRPFFQLAGVGCRALLGVVRALAGLPGAALSVPAPSPVVTAVSLGLVTLGLSLAARGRRPKLGHLLASVGALVWLAAILPATGRNSAPGEHDAPSGANVPPSGEPASVRLLIRSEAGAIRVELATGDARAVPLAATSPGVTSDSLPAGVRVERLGRALGAPEALRVEFGGRAALVLSDLGGRELAQLLETEPEGRLRASVLVVSTRPSRALESLALRTRPLVIVVPSSRAASAVAERLVEVGLAPLELARTGPVEIELGESVSVRALP